MTFGPVNAEGGAVLRLLAEIVAAFKKLGEERIGELVVPITPMTGGATSFLLES